MKTLKKLSRVALSTVPCSAQTPQDSSLMLGLKNFLPRRSQRPLVPGLNLLPPKWTSGLGSRRAFVWVMSVKMISFKHVVTADNTYDSHVGINFEAIVLQIRIFMPLIHISIGARGGYGT
jgi:hypothetical protein